MQIQFDLDIAVLNEDQRHSGYTHRGILSTNLTDDVIVFYGYGPQDVRSQVFDRILVSTKVS